MNHRDRRTRPASAIEASLTKVWRPQIIEGKRAYVCDELSIRRVTWRKPGDFEKTCSGFAVFRSGWQVTAAFSRLVDAQVTAEGM